MDATRHDSTTHPSSTESIPAAREPFGSPGRSRLAALAVTVGLTVATGAVATASLGGSDSNESAAVAPPAQSPAAIADDTGDGQDSDSEAVPSAPDGGAGEESGGSDTPQPTNPGSPSEPTPSNPGPGPDPSDPSDPDPQGGGTSTDGLTIDLIKPGITVPQPEDDSLTIDEIKPGITVPEGDDGLTIDLIKPGITVPALLHDESLPIGPYGTGVLVLTNQSMSPISWTIIDSDPDLHFSKTGLDEFVESGLSGVVAAGNNGAIVVAPAPGTVLDSDWSRTFVLAHGGTEHEITVHASS